MFLANVNGEGFEIDPDLLDRMPAENSVDPKFKTLKEM
jgi:hypothetical protein